MEDAVDILFPILFHIVLLVLYRSITFLFGLVSVTFAVAVSIAFDNAEARMAIICGLLTVPAVGLTDWAHRALLKMSEAGV